MTTSKLLFTAWDFEWSINAGCVFALMLYFWKVQASLWHRVSFVLGIVVLFLSLQSPLDLLGDTYLFSAHMAQHLFLILIVPPLFLLGISEREVRSWLRAPSVAGVERILGNPYVGWLAGVSTMTLWHIPVLYNYALAHVLSWTSSNTHVAGITRGGTAWCQAAGEVTITATVAVHVVQGTDPTVSGAANLTCM